MCLLITFWGVKMTTSFEFFSYATKHEVLEWNLSSHDIVQYVKTHPQSLLYLYHHIFTFRFVYCM